MSIRTGRSRRTAFVNGKQLRNVQRKIWIFHGNLIGIARFVIIMNLGKLCNNSEWRGEQCDGHEPSPSVTTHNVKQFSSHTYIIYRSARTTWSTKYRRWLREGFILTNKPWNKRITIEYARTIYTCIIYYIYIDVCFWRTNLTTILWR